MCARDPNQTVSSSQSKYDVTIPISLIFCWEQLNEPCGVKTSGLSLFMLILLT